jgi:hypothetical protein
MGLLLDKDSLKDRENIPESLTRTEVQEYISESIFGENIVTAYSPEDEIETEDGSFVIDAGTIINYTLDVSGSQTLYLDCYDTHTISLSEPIFDSLSVTVNGIKITDDYPKKTNNGVLYLGDFANEQVTVKIWCQKSIICRSFGIFGIDIDRLSSLCSSAEGANLTETANGLSGSCKLSESRTCMVSLPYSGNYTVKVNGKKVSYSRTLSDFISFDLSAGENEISISYIPDGFVMGLIISVIGVAAFAAYIYIRRKIRLSRDRSTKYRCEKFGIAAKYIMLTVALAASAAVYIFPVIVNILYTGVA